MSATTITIPADQADAIRASLIDRRAEAAGPAEVDRLLRQLDGGKASYALTGPVVLIWNALYDVLCSAAERLAEECNEYWSGSVDPDALRARIAEVQVRFELLVGLGAPPGRRSASD